VAPVDSIWRTRIDRLPVATRSTAYVNAIGAGRHLKADFGSGTWDGAPMGIPITRVPAGARVASRDVVEWSCANGHEVGGSSSRVCSSG
jgi:hypothetical protein